MSLGKKRPSVVDFEDWEQEEALAGLSGLSLAKEDEGHRPFKRSKSFSSGMELESPEIPAHNPLSPILFTTPSKTLLLTHTPLSDSPLDLSLFDDDDEDDEAEQKDQKDSSIPDFLLKPLKDQTNSSPIPTTLTLNPEHAQLALYRPPPNFGLPVDDTVTAEEEEDTEEPGAESMDLD